MTVYVESNFILEIALGQREAATAASILQAAARQEFVLAIPSNALFEPFSTVNRRLERRNRPQKELAEIIGDLKRSEPHRDDVDALERALDLFLAIEERERERLNQTVQLVLDTATVIAIDARTYGEALDCATAFGFNKMQDALVFAAVRRDLNGRFRQGLDVFVTKDKSDFSFPTVKDVLDGLDCKIVYSFGACARMLRLETEP